MLGHLGINVANLATAKTYYNALMPSVGFEPFLDEHDQFAFRPAGGKPGTYLFFATFWLDPFGLMLEAVCHHDRE